MSDVPRMLARSAVFVLLRNEQDKILLVRRYKTGYLNGWYDIPAGHVESGEAITDTAVRELREETGIEVAVPDLKLWHINQFFANGEAYYNFFFLAETWHGKPRIMEADKCDDMQFFTPDELPKLTPASKVALDHFNDDPVSFGFIDQATYDTIVGKHE